MYQFTGGAGNPSGCRNPQTISYNGQQLGQHISYPPPWPTTQPYQVGMTAQDAPRLNTTSIASSQGCYNCGVLNHWAQNCPEPHRAVPAGAMANQRPKKRQKTSAPIITQYPVTPTSGNWGPHIQQLQALQRGFTHPPLSQKLQQYTPAMTPTSTNSNSPGPWQQQSWLPSPLPRHHSQQWNSQGLPSPSGANECHRTSPILLASSGARQNGFLPQPSMTQNSPTSTLLVRNGSFDALSQKPGQGLFVEERASSVSQQDMLIQGERSEMSKYDVQQRQGEESWWEELQALDYSTGLFDSKHAVVSHPANPVAEPLPCIMRDKDLVARLPIAASLPAGTPISKYFRNLNVDDFMRNSFDNVDCGNSVADPASVILTTEGEAISKDELIARRREVAAMAHNTTRESGEFTEDDLEQAATADEAKDFEDNGGRNADGLPTPCQSHESEEERQAREQEEKLAALGVTGFAKPLRTSIRRSTLLATSESSEDREILVECGSALHPAAQNAQRRNPFKDSVWGGYRSSGSPPGNYHGNSLQTPPTSACHDSRSDSNDDGARRLSSNSTQSAPTSSPTYGKYLHPDLSAFEIADSTAEHRDGRKGPASGEITSMGMIDDKLNPGSSNHSGQGPSRKRSSRDFSAEVDEGPKRQKDEGHQKDRRKAPKVAAAYSRRW